MAATNYSARLTCEIQACLVDIIPIDVAGIIAEYSLRTEQEKLICVLETARGRSIYNGHTASIHFDTSGFPNGKITKFVIEITGKWTRFENKHYTMVISGPGGEIGSTIGFNDLCVDSSYWMGRGSGILQTAGIEYRRQMLEMMSQF